MNRESILRVAAGTPFSVGLSDFCYKYQFFQVQAALSFNNKSAIRQACLNKE